MQEMWLAIFKKYAIFSILIIKRVCFILFYWTGMDSIEDCCFLKSCHHVIIPCINKTSLHFFFKAYCNFQAVIG